MGTRQPPLPTCSITGSVVQGNKHEQQHAFCLPGRAIDVLRWRGAGVWLAGQAPARRGPSLPGNTPAPKAGGSMPCPALPCRSWSGRAADPAPMPQFQPWAARSPAGRNAHSTCRVHVQGSPPPPPGTEGAGAGGTPAPRRPPPGSAGASRASAPERPAPRARVPAPHRAPRRGPGRAGGAGAHTAPLPCRASRRTTPTGPQAPESACREVKGGDSVGGLVMLRGVFAGPAGSRDAPPPGRRRGRALARLPGVAGAPTPCHPSCTPAHACMAQSTAAAALQGQALRPPPPCALPPGPGPGTPNPGLP